MSPLSAPQVDPFTSELLIAGTTLSDVAAELIETLSPEDYPGEDPAAVVLEMVSGSVRTWLSAAEPADVDRATELIAGARRRIIEHLELAIELQKRGEGGDGGEPIPVPSFSDAPPAPAPGVLTDLCAGLVDCGGIISQIVAAIVDHTPDPDLEPGLVHTPALAVDLVAGAVSRLRDIYSLDEIELVARVIRDASELLADGVFRVPDPPDADGSEC